MALRAVAETTSTLANVVTQGVHMMNKFIHLGYLAIIAVLLVLLLGEQPTPVATAAPAVIEANNPKP